MLFSAVDSRRPARLAGPCRQRLLAPAPAPAGRAASSLTCQRAARGGFPLADRPRTD